MNCRHQWFRAKTRLWAYEHVLAYTGDSFFASRVIAATVAIREPLVEPLEIRRERRDEFAEKGGITCSFENLEAMS
jgi:hypothetical protein